ncbi:hypothetical protein BGW36DRAFT_354495 [Talaromyces proteolyticus]|uniref:Beta-mannosidase Ig-fold domain-containing protein n=1 Tax=Talaromyces proteolyticus TaxID=1131652 RepID=A0AAD4L3U1_9EURO|nr:uncharacterized protein BGW36DRAFT_354495 [Talaromyces proteolyticus]KAH8703062.1 hypothetical protein BGW36DRAFT_354495 [Talaromyces proteolyticus]
MIDSYNYNVNQVFDASSYPISRFATEFGLQSMSSIYSRKQAVPKDQLSFFSDMVIHRNRQYGDGDICLVLDNSSLPCRLLHLELAFYRHEIDMPNRTLGSMYWKLERLWTAPTWAIQGNGKAIVDGLGTAVSGPVGGNDTQFILFTIGAINSTLAYNANVQINAASTHDLTDLVLQIDMSALGQAPNSEISQKYAHTSYFHPVSLQEEQPQDPGFILAYSTSNGAYEYTVKATMGIVAWVWLEHPLGVYGHFSDNGFWLAKGESKIIHFIFKNDWAERVWVRDVQLRSLWNNTIYSE